MKKYLAVVVLVGLFAVTPVFAETGAENQSLWNKLMSFFNPSNVAEQTAATVVSQKKAVTAVSVEADAFDVPQAAGEFIPTSATQSNCGQTLTPFGLTNQTIRCDGRSWVAAANLLNDGISVGVGTEPQHGAKLGVVNTTGSNAISAWTDSTTKSAVRAINNGSGPAVSAEGQALGVSSSGRTGVSGVGVGSNSVGVVGGNFNTETDTTGIGVLGKVVNGTGVFGHVSGGGTGTAVKAVYEDSSPVGGYGFYQQGENARNYFAGPTKIGDPSGGGWGYMLNVIGRSNPGGIGGTAIRGVAGTGVGGGVGVFGEANGNLTVGVKGVSTGINTAVLAEIQGNGVVGFQQTGANGLNIIEGNLRVGGVAETPLHASVKAQIYGGLKILPDTNLSKPACAESIRGVIWYGRGGTNVADTVEICVKNAAGSYAWRVI